MKNADNNVLLFSIQRFSIHDGPGIRTTVFFKGCPLRCPWCQNPESYSVKPEIAYYQEKCKATQSCIDACPEKATKFLDGLLIDRNRCKGCGNCVVACPEEALKLFGEWWHCDELIQEVVKDQDFFRDSGGGVTLSGGEPFLQTEFLQLFLPSLKKYQLHCLVQTCGHFLWEKVKPLLTNIDHIFFDLKHYNSEVHKKLTGKRNEVILKNLQKLQERGFPCTIRIPLIPHINDSGSDVMSFCQLLRQYAIKTIIVVPYHRLGSDKFDRVGKGERKFLAKPHDDEELERIRQQFLNEGIDAAYER